jgi:hypothetical protein
MEKMKKLFKGAFFLALIGSAIVGCEKENEESMLKNNLNSIVIKEKQKTNKSIDFSNDNNPFDYIGENHNNLMAELEDYSYPTDTTVCEDSVKSKTHIEYLNIYPTGTLIDLDALNELNNFEGDYAAINYMSYSDILSEIDDLDESELITDYIDDLLQLEINENTTTAEAHDLILALENNYINNHSGAQTDEFYCTSAILRYSFLGEFNGGNNGSTELGRKWKIAIADAIGGAIGGLAGAGPFSALGALQGAAAASTIANIFLN